MKVLIVLAAVAAVALAAPAYGPSYHKEYDSYAPAYYNFGYAVKDDYTYADFGHQENRNGDNTKGSYYVVLPDGRRQTVNYYVDGYSGFVADVQYSGDYKAAPAYKAPAYPAYPAKPAYGPRY